MESAEQFPVYGTESPVPGDHIAQIPGLQTSRPDISSELKRYDVRGMGAEEWEQRDYDTADDDKCRWTHRRLRQLHEEVHPDVLYKEIKGLIKEDFEDGLATQRRTEYVSNTETSLLAKKRASAAKRICEPAWQAEM